MVSRDNVLCDMSIAHAVAFVNMFFISIFCPRLCLFAEYASHVKEVIFPVMRGFFGQCGLTKRGDSDKMIRENKASERSTPPVFYHTLTCRLENEL